MSTSRVSPFEILVKERLLASFNIMRPSTQSTSVWVGFSSFLTPTIKKKTHSNEHILTKQTFQFLFRIITSGSGVPRNCSLLTVVGKYQIPAIIFQLRRKHRSKLAFIYVLFFLSIPRSHEIQRHGSIFKTWASSTF